MRSCAHKTPRVNVDGRTNGQTDGRTDEQTDGNLHAYVAHAKAGAKKTKDQVKKYFIYESKKCSGISKHTVKKDITIDDYYDTLFSSTEKKHSLKLIKSHNHNIKSYDITKRSLSCFYNKRYILKDRITTLAYGHSYAFRRRHKRKYPKTIEAYHIWHCLLHWIKDMGVY